MKMQKVKFTYSFLIGIALLLSVWHSARAWRSVAIWGNSAQNYRISSSVPVSFRPYVNKGANAWTNVTPSSWTWTLSSISGGLAVKYEYIDGPDHGLAITKKTLFNGAIISAVTRIDNSENWYVGSGIPDPLQYDLWSTTTHEMGHGLGLDHHTTNIQIYCPGNTYDATMCAGMPKGTYYKRTLAGDDRNGLNNLYP